LTESRHAILHVISGLGTGGAETMLVRLAGALRDRGFEQHVVSVGGRDAKAAEIEALGIGVSALGLRTAVQVPGCAMRLRSIAMRFRPTILQGWMYHGDLFATLAHGMTTGRARRRLFWNIRASNTDHAGYGRILRLSALLSARADVILANSKAGLDFHLAKGYRPKRACVIPNGIDMARYRPDGAVRAAFRREFGIAPDAVVTIHVARLDPMKDHRTFLDAMALCPALSGIIVGLGTDTLQVPPNVKALGVRADVHQLYAAADIVVSTSVFAEGFSNVLAEGMSSGLIPITTAIGDARLIIGDVGVEIPPRDPASLARELNSLAALPAQQLRHRGLAARTRIEQNFTLDRVADHFATLYSER